MGPNGTQGDTGMTGQQGILGATVSTPTHISVVEYCLFC